MSSKAYLPKGFYRSAIRVAAVALVLASTARETVANPEIESFCRQASLLALDDTLRFSPTPGSEDLFLRLEVLEPGLLLLDAAAPGTAEADPVLVASSAGCGGSGAAPRPAVVGRTRTSLLLAVSEPGDYLFRLSSGSLPDLKVRSRFLPAGEAAFADKAGEDPEEIEMEVDPAPLNTGPQEAGEDPEEIEMEVDPAPNKAGEDPEEIEMEVDPAPIVVSGTFELDLARAKLCARGKTDDHGDSFECATSLTASAAAGGELANGWGDDADVFRFVLPGDPEIDLRAVDLSSRGPAGTLGVLFDRRGRRLARSGTEDGGFRLRDVLPPGVYFVRVESGSRTEGRYRLSLSVSEP